MKATVLFLFPCGRPLSHDTRDLRIFDFYPNFKNSQEITKWKRIIHWKIKRNDKRFFEHEIQFSTLEDEDNESRDGNYELADLEQAPETLLMKALQSEELKQALAQLSQEEVELFETLIHDNVNEEDYGVKIGISQQGVSKKKQKIIKKLKKLLKSGCENG